MNLGRIAVLGAGSWGTTFAKVLADAQPEAPVCLWGRRADVVSDILQHRRNTEYLPNILLPPHLSADTRVERVLDGAEMVVFALPAQSVRSFVREWRDLLPPQAIVVSLMKGLERESDARMSVLFREELDLPDHRFAVVSGPNLALEIAREQPCASVVASASATTAWEVAHRCCSHYFVPRASTDVVGVEVGGVMKNVIALAVGMCMGLGLGDNAKASVMTQGLTEMSRLVLAMGGRNETVLGLSGLGDLAATCSSPLSRNATAGRWFGEGLNASEVLARMGQTVEGLASSRAVYDLAEKLQLQMPMTRAIVDVTEGKRRVHDVETCLLGGHVVSWEMAGKGES